MTRIPAHHRRRAFAAVTAIVMIGLVASTLAALAVMFAADARRTRAASTEAQLRQLLIAGAADVQQRLDKGETCFDVKLATPAEGQVTLKAVAEADKVEATIVATIRSRAAQQTIRFARDEKRWTLNDVRLTQ